MQNAALLSAQSAAGWQQMWQTMSWQVLVSHRDRLTSADGPVAHVAGLAGAAVAPDGVGADCILITLVLPTATLIVL